MELTITFTFILLFKYILSNPSSYTFTSEDEFYSMSIRMEPFQWLVYIDTYHDYFILYDYPGGDEWPKKIINECSYMFSKEKVTISNYDKQIPSTVYSTQIALPDFPSNKTTINIYYTKEKGQNSLIWQVLPSNVKQLSFGLGISSNSSNSFIPQLYDNGFINAKKFALEHKTMIYIHLGNKYEISPYKNNETILLKDNDNHWGFHLNSITLNSIKYKVNQFVFINSALRQDISSSFIYNIIKTFLLQHNNDCEENTHSYKLTLVCKYDDLMIWPNMTISIGEGISFSLTLKHFFKCSNEICYLNNIVRNDNENDTEKEISIHVGKRFLSIFNLIEFDYDKRSITFHSNKITFIKKHNILYHEINSKYIMIFTSISLCLYTIFLLCSKYYIINKQQFII